MRWTNETQGHPLYYRDSDSRVFGRLLATPNATGCWDAWWWGDREKFLGTFVSYAAAVKAVEGHYQKYFRGRPGFETLMGREG